jgi:hypothetical protein
MTLLDNGWTDEQTQGLLHSLNLDGGTPKTVELPSGNPNTSKGYDPGAQLTKRTQPPSMGNLGSSPMSFAIPTKASAWLSSTLRPLKRQERQGARSTTYCAHSAPGTEADGDPETRWLRLSARAKCGN